MTTPRRLLVISALALLAASCGSTDGQGGATLESEVADAATTDTTAGADTTAASEPTTTSTAPEATSDGEQDTETVDVFRLRIGECLLMPTQGIEGEQVETLEAIPCGEPHNGEVLSIEIVAGDDGAPYPGDEAISDEAETRCLASFKSVTGRNFATDPFWDLTFLSPTSESWTLGNDREIVCIVLPLDGELTTDLVADNLAG